MSSRWSCLTTHTCTISLLVLVAVAGLGWIRSRPSLFTRNSPLSPDPTSTAPRPLLYTPKFAANHSERVLNVHIVPHTHDDVGWLKTVEQYYYGLNQTIQRAAVQYILTSVLHALKDNPNRTFTYVEQKFFFRWWNQQSSETQGIVKELVHKTRQWSFVNGGWCMHDEATTHYVGMIDQTTLGHVFLQQALDYIPTVGWQLDPFGHSATQASLLTHHMGFDALYFGRIDHEDRAQRQQTQDCEGLWDASSSNNSTVFWGLTGSFTGIYGAPSGFCFDVNCQDEPLVGQDERRLLERVMELLQDVKVQSSRTKGNHVMLTMGDDFQYSNALVNYANLDLLIHSILHFQEDGTIDVASLLGPSFDRIAVFYSTPEYYTQQKYQEYKQQAPPKKGAAHPSTKTRAVQWSTKTDDFFPYSDCPHCFWTGYFTSRAAFKRLERVGSSFLHAARQIETILPAGTDSTHIRLARVNHSDQDCDSQRPLAELEDALGVVQHHDAVSGTAKQHVANDYSRRVQAGINRASRFVTHKLRQLLLESDGVNQYLQDLTFCQLLNETTCSVSERASKDRDKDLYIVVYNGLATNRSTIVGIPMTIGNNYTVSHIAEDSSNLNSQSVVQWRKAVGTSKFLLYFDTGSLPPMGAKVFKISFVPPASHKLSRLDSSKQARRELVAETSKGACQGSNREFSNGILSVRFNCDTGTLEQISNLAEGSNVSLAQEWGYYTSFDAAQDTSPDGLEQNSGAYIFRPKTPNEQLKKVFPKSQRAQFTVWPIGVEVKTFFEGSWIEQTTRLFHGQPFVEIQYKIGPVPIDDGVGKEVVTRFSTPIQSEGRFHTDSNGREFQKRVRSYRPTWNLTEYEPVAGNYYPVNAAMYIEDESTSLAVLVDRSQGGASLFDGSIELMVQRRMLADDGRGVGEPLNETTGGVTPYPPYGDATRVGEGVTIIGKHRLMVGKGNQGASLARSQMDGAFAEPFVFVGTAAKDSTVPFRQKSFSGLQQSLPPNVMLVTCQLLHTSESSFTFMLRLGHQYAIGEDSTLSKPAEVDVGQLLEGYKVESLIEKTLSGNRDYADWVKNRFDWSGAKVDSHRNDRSEDNGFVVSLHPMEIRTFEVRARAIQ